MKERKILTKQIVYYGKPAILMCDGRCTKAWGINNRPKLSLSLDSEDYAFLADDELGPAPSDPGTYEGGHGKPRTPRAMNKWCARECERSRVVGLPDFSSMVRNRAEAAEEE